MTSNNLEYIYLLQEREFVKTNENIYKIGKTKQNNLKRFSSYPNGSKLLIQVICNNCDITENIILNKFKNIFIQKKDIGFEYFTGDVYKMIDLIYETAKEDNKTYLVNEDNKCEKCLKTLSSKQYLKKHLLVCKGMINPLECCYCHKILCDSSSKTKHLKICKKKEIKEEDEDNNELIFYNKEKNLITFHTNHINNLTFENISSTYYYDKLNYFIYKLFENKNNRFIIKSSLRNNYSYVHIGLNKWENIYDDNIFKIIIHYISETMLLFIDTDDEIINRLNYNMSIITESVLIKEYKQKYKMNIKYLKHLFYTF